MTFPKARVVVAACLFLSWLGFLFFLVLERKSVVLSPPQFLIAQTIVVAEIKDANGSPDANVAVKEVLSPAGETLTKIRLAELAEFGKAKGYHGPGVYLIPMVRREAGFTIAPRPTFDKTPRMPWIYPWTNETRAQVEEIIGRKNPE